MAQVVRFGVEGEDEVCPLNPYDEQGRQVADKHSGHDQARRHGHEDIADSLF